MKRNFILSDEERDDIAQRVVDKLNNKYISAREAARLLGCSISTIYKNKDKYHYVKEGDKRQSPIRFPIKDLL